MLLRCDAYERGHWRASLTPEEIPNFFADSQEGFVWVVLDEPDNDELAFFGKLFSLHKLAVEDALTGKQRPKVEEYGDTLFTVLRTLTPGSDAGKPYETGQISVFTGKHYVLTVRRNSMFDFEQVRRYCEKEPEMLALGTGFVLYAVIDLVVDSFFPIIEELEDIFEKLEDRVFSNDQMRRNLKSFYKLKKKLLSAKHAIAPLMEATARLSGGRVPTLCEPLMDYYRDIADHLARLNSTLDTIREMLHTTLQVGLTLIGLREDEITKKLAAWAAMLALPTMVAGLYGMNFDFLPGMHWQWGAFVCVLVLVLMDVFLYFRFKKAGWL